eukprot:9572065-Lingulodinium_polyedra.AAC.1
MVASFHAKGNPAGAPSQKRFWKGVRRAPNSSQVSQGQPDGGPAAPEPFWQRSIKRSGGLRAHGRAFCA